MNVIGKEEEEKVTQEISHSHWYKKIMIDSMPCSDYWLLEKEEMNRQLQELLNESNALEEDKFKKTEKSRVHKDNAKIIELEGKFDCLLEEYSAMMGLQTSWKAECQLYEYFYYYSDES